VLWLILRVLSRSGARMIAEQTERIQKSPEARAKIVQIGESRVINHTGAFRVKLRLEIFPLDLQSSFETTTVWDIEPARMNEIAVGKMLRVKFDEEDPASIYPLEPWAKFNFLYHKLRRPSESSEVQINQGF
jgi:hypothetical protein